MAYNTPETVADYLARFQMEITHRGKGTFTPDHVKYSLTIASGGKDFFTTFESNPHVHGEPTITQVFGALASDAMVVRDYGMDEFVDEFCDGMKPSAAIRAYNSCKETYDWMRDGLYLSNGDIASLSEVISENEEEIGALVEFYDTEDNGQFVASFHMNTLLGYPWNGMVGADLDGLEAYGFAYPLSTQAATDWLEGDDLAKVNAFLKETCKEAFGILPGADDGGYSLSGEAKEAALSRFALPENRKAALNVIRKLNESRASNDNAL